MNITNLVSKCYVIASMEYGVAPFIYLYLPETADDILEFDNPFTARNYIRWVYGSEIEVAIIKPVQARLAG